MGKVLQLSLISQVWRDHSYWKVFLPVWVVLLVFLVHTCEKIEPAPLLLLHTDSISEISYTDILIEATILHLGETDITQHGFCWSEQNNPSVESDTTSQLGWANKAGSYSQIISGLSPGNTYHIKPYATDAHGTVYGEEKSFKTVSISVPVVTTFPVTNISMDSAWSGGDVLHDGGLEVTSRGICWSRAPDPSIETLIRFEGIGTGSFASVLTRMSCGTTYYVCAFATNAEGTGYGEILEFKTAPCPDGLPTVQTMPVNDITENSAWGGGNVTDEGGSPVIQRGICWITWPKEIPISTDPHTNNGGGPGSFSSYISNLECGVSYYVRAYAQNESGIAYGELVTVKTKECRAVLPELTTTEVSNITQTSAQGGGKVIDDGGSEVTAKGVCWGISELPDLSDSFTENGTGTGSFISTMTRLACGTRYYVRSYATNAEGTAYGTQLEFTTLECHVDPPTVVTSQVTTISQNSAQGGGDVLHDGGNPVSAKGICWSISPNPTLEDSHTNDGHGLGSFTSVMDNLLCGTVYFVRAYATNSGGTAYGNQEEFTTSLCHYLPTVTTLGIVQIRENSVNVAGEVALDGNTPVIEKGICWSTTLFPTIENSKTSEGEGTGVFESYIDGLASNTYYHVRAYATNSEGTAYGEDIEFLTWEGSVADYDGNVYPTVNIGEQTWMQANLRATRYQDGTPIPLVQSNEVWEEFAIDQQAYCWYENDSANLEVYGALYTWAAAMHGENSPDADVNPSGVQGVCPDGWHLPSNNEWIDLELYLGMDPEDAYHTAIDRGIDEGGKLKETGEEHWKPNVGATNETGFTALPSGYRSPGGFLDLNAKAFYWTSTGDGFMSSFRSIYGHKSTIEWNAQNNDFGFSVRCLKDY